MKTRVYSQTDAYTDSCRHHECVMALFMLLSGVCLEEEYAQTVFHCCSVEEAQGCPREANAYTL